jgi:hypothetical protein
LDAKTTAMGLDQAITVKPIASASTRYAKESTLEVTRGGQNRAKKALDTIKSVGFAIAAMQFTMSHWSFIYKSRNSR